MRLTFAVPRQTTTCFVITADRAPADPSAVIPWRMPRPHRREAAATLGTPRLTITCHPPSLVVVSGTAPPSQQPKVALVARAAARAVAEACDGVVEDPLTGRVISTDSDRRQDPATFRLTEDWLGWRVERHGDATRPARWRPPRQAGAVPPDAVPGVSPPDPDHPGVAMPGVGARGVAMRRDDVRRDDVRRAETPGSGTPGGITGPEGPVTPTGPSASPAWSVRTRGLCRFGLPELMLEPATCAHGHDPFDLLHAVAQRLLDDHLAWMAANPAAGVRTIGDRIRVAADRVPAASHPADARRSPRRDRPMMTTPADDDAATATATGATGAAAGSGSAVGIPPWGMPPAAGRFALVRLSLARMPSGAAARRAGSRASGAGTPGAAEFRTHRAPGTEVLKIGPPEGCDGDPGGVPCLTCGGMCLTSGGTPSFRHRAQGQAA